MRAEMISYYDLVMQLFLQLAVILGVCRVAAIVGERLGQARVVSEMVAGVLIGPSLFGLIFPDVQSWLFPTQLTIAQGGATVTIPHPSMTILYAISQVGLVLYMFVVGMEFDAKLLLGRLRSAWVVSVAGIVVPLALGAGIALALSDGAGLFRPGIAPGAAALYLGAAMSITAFPMLARIIQEKGMTKTRLGTLTLAAGATDDALAWCLLAVVLSAIKGTWSLAVLAIGGGVVYVLAMLTAGRRLLAPLEARVARDGRLTAETMAIALLVLMLNAFATDWIGIYAVFGAFIAGVAMPRGRFTEEMTRRIEQLVTVFLLPVFFVYSGLNTSIGLLTGLWLWGLAALLIGVAIGAKGLACALAARAAGEPWREAARSAC